MSEPTPTTRQSKPASSDVARPAPVASSHDRPRVLPTADLHEAFGNLGTLQRLADPAVQAKLEIGSPDDEYEREADAVAASVMRGGTPDIAGTGGPGVGPSAGISRAPESIQRSPEDDKKKPIAPAATKPPAASAKAKAPEPPKATAPKVPAPAAAPKTPTKAETPKSAEAPKAAPAKGPGQSPTKGPDAAQSAGAAKGPTATKAAGPTKAEPPKAPEGTKPKPVERAKAEPEKTKPETAQPAEDAAKPEERKKTDEPTVATKATPGATPAVTPAAARTIQGAQGGGQPLAAADRSFYESRLGRDLSGVRVHDGAAAHRAAKDIQAQAFTYGQDIFFGAGRHQPGTAAGRELMAHELAHTIQQRPGAKLDRKVQRSPAPAASPAAPTTAAATPATPTGKRNDATKEITFPSLKVPLFRTTGKSASKYAGKLIRPAGYSRKGLEAQRSVWIAGTSAALTKPVEDFLTKKKAVPHGDGKQYYLKSAGGKGGNLPDRFYLGSPAELAAELATPEWDRAGAGHGFRGFQVDHVLELQIAGKDTAGANKMDNLELLDKAVNGASGSFIQKNIDDAMTDYLASIPETERKDPALGFDKWRSTWTLIFEKGEGAASGKEPTENDQWTADEIKKGTHLDKGPLTEAAGADLGSATKIAVFPAGSGGIMTMLEPKAGAAGVQFFKPFKTTGATFNVDPGQESNPDLATFTFELDNPALNAPPPPPISVKRLPDAQYAGVIDRGAAKSMLKGISAKKFSPIEIGDVEVGPNGLYVQAQIITDVPLIKGSPIDLVLDGTKLTVSKTFDLGDFKLPPPMKATQTSLTIAATSEGELSAKGRVDLEIDKVGKGYLSAGGGTSGLELAGRFDFTTELFDEANISFAYAKGEFSGNGKLSLAPGKVKGVKKGVLTASYAAGKLVANGHVDFDVPGIDSADMGLTFDEAGGLKVTGDAKLKELPGIKGGSLSVTVAQQGGGGPFKVSGKGTAQPNIPGVDAQLTVDYDDGAFLAKVEVPFERGLIKGKLEAGATNAPVGDDGKLTPGGKGEGDVRIFGGGEASVQITPWLVGTAGMKLLPNGEISVKGELTVPGVNLWKGKDFSKPLFDSPPIELPIFGPVVLAISGGVRLKAGINPGVLSGKLGIEYNPSHEDQTHLTGKIKLSTGAYAGLELYTRVGLGLSAVIGSVTGNIELGAEMRIEPTVSAELDLDWRPTTGVKLGAEVKASLQPKFIFSLSAVVVARAGPFSKDWTKKLGQRAFGSGLELGMSMPVKYEEGKPFNPSLDDITFTIPQIDATQTAKNFLKEVAR